MILVLKAVMVGSVLMHVETPTKKPVAQESFVYEQDFSEDSCSGFEEK